MLHQGCMLAAVALFYILDYLQVCLIYTFVMAEKPERQSCSDAFKFYSKVAYVIPIHVLLAKVNHLSKLTSMG